MLTETLPPVAQQPIADLGRATCDVIVAGAGPAGGASAALLASQGLEVLLVDRARFPREKVCGDALVLEALEALQRIGLEAEVRSQAVRFPSYTLVSPQGAAVSFNNEISLLPRRKLDALIAGKAVADGATFAQGQLRSAQAASGGDMVCMIDDQELHCRVLVLAPGADLSLLQALGMSASPKPEEVAMRQYYRSRRGPDRPSFFLKEAFLPGYAWIFPMGQNCYNVGCIRFLSRADRPRPPLRSAFDDFLQSEPLAKELVSQAEEATPLRGGSLRCGMHAPAEARRGRILVAGEAIGSTIPGWGEGVSTALQTGLLAAEVTQEAFRESDFSRLAEYPRRLKSEVKRGFAKHARFTVFFNRPWTANLLINLARMAPAKWR
jgi:menaquinone-9 beta-reductase